MIVFWGAVRKVKTRENVIGRCGGTAGRHPLYCCLSLWCSAQSYTIIMHYSLAISLFTHTTVQKKKKKKKKKIYFISFLELHNSDTRSPPPTLTQLSLLRVFKCRVQSESRMTVICHMGWWFISGFWERCKCGGVFFFFLQSEADWLDSLSNVLSSWRRRIIPCSFYSMTREKEKEETRKAFLSSSFPC